MSTPETPRDAAPAAPAPATSPDWLDRAQFMQRLALTREAFNAMILQGVPHVRVTQRTFRFYWPDVERWMRRRARAEARRAIPQQEATRPQPKRPRRRRRYLSTATPTAVHDTATGAVLGDPRFQALAAQLRT